MGDHVGGAIDRNHQVDVPRRCDGPGQGVSERDLERRGADDDNVVTDRPEDLCRLGEQPRGCHDLYDHPATSATASAASSARSPSEAQSSQSCTGSASGSPFSGCARPSVHGSGATAS
jgi:hypothetical protein